MKNKCAVKRATYVGFVLAVMCTSSYLFQSDQPVAQLAPDGSLVTTNRFEYQNILEKNIGGNALSTLPRDWTFMYDNDSK